MANDLLLMRRLLVLLPFTCWSSPGAGIVGSFREILFKRDERLRSKLGEALPGERCNPALMAAAAWRDDSEGDLGEGGLGLAASIDMRRGR